MVTATDADSNRNGMIVYEIVSGNDEDKFKITVSDSLLLFLHPRLPYLPYLPHLPYFNGHSFVYIFNKINPLENKIIAILIWKLFEFQGAITVTKLLTFAR